MVGPSHSLEFDVELGRCEEVVSLFEELVLKQVGLELLFLGDFLQLKTVPNAPLSLLAVGLAEFYGLSELCHLALEGNHVLPGQTIEVLLCLFS